MALAAKRNSLLQHGFYFLPFTFLRNHTRSPSGSFAHHYCMPFLYQSLSLSLCLEEPSRALHAEISIKISLTTPAFIPMPLYRLWVCILMFSHLTLTMGVSFLNSHEKLRAYWRTNVGLEGRPHSLWEHKS